MPKTSTFVSMVSQRQVVDKRTWRELVAFFPCAMPFRAESSECLECLGDTVNERRAEEAVKKERGQEIAVPALKALFARKTGVRYLIRVPHRGYKGLISGMCLSAARCDCAEELLAVLLAFFRATVSSRWPVALPNSMYSF